MGNEIRIGSPVILGRNVISFIKYVLKIAMMNIYLVFGIISALSLGSLFAAGGVLINPTGFAQENMTMNTSAEAPVDNTTEISDTGAGLDANMMMGDNMTGMNMTEPNMTGMQ